MQQAIGQSGLISVEETQLAGGRWDSKVGSNTPIWVQGSHSGLREGISQRWTVWTVWTGQQDTSLMEDRLAGLRFEQINEEISLFWFSFQLESLMRTKMLNVNLMSKSLI